jgi:hypothetical protein
MAQFVFADIRQGATARSAVLEAGAVLVHFTEFLAHEADDFHPKHWLSSDEIEKCTGGDEAEGAVSFAAGAETIRGGAEGCGKSDDTAGTEDSFEDLAAIKGENGNAREAVLNDVDPAAFGTLAHDDFVAKCGDRLGECLDGI